MKGKTRLVIVGLLLALGGASFGAWPWISAERRYRTQFLSSSKSLAKRFPDTIDMFVSTRMSNAPPPIFGFDVVNRWTSNIRFRVFWNQAGWRVYQIRRINHDTAIGQFWIEGKPDAAYRFKRMKNPGYPKRPWRATRLPDSSRHFPKPLTEPDAPWLLNDKEPLHWIVQKRKK